MSAAVHETRTIRIPALRTGHYTLAILHRQRWHETRLRGSYEDALQIAVDAHRRSGLVVQLRDDDGAVLFEANDQNQPWGDQRA
jgi:hypothetical protein